MDYCLIWCNNVLGYFLYFVTNKCASTLCGNRKCYDNFYLLGFNLTHNLDLLVCNFDLKSKMFELANQSYYVIIDSIDIKLCAPAI